MMRIDGKTSPAFHYFSQVGDKTFIDVHYIFAFTAHQVTMRFSGISEGKTCRSRARIEEVNHPGSMKGFECSIDGCDIQSG
jgi:hypothetical protein